MAEHRQQELTDVIDGVRDTVMVRRVFGEPFERDGATVIPVAAIRGGGGLGQGGGEEHPDDAVTGGSAGQATRDGWGSGGGFGFDARPVGVYVARNGEVRWEPAVDFNRLMTTAAVIWIALAVVLRGALKRRRR